MYAPTLTYAETTEGQMTLTPGHPENENHTNDHVSSFLRGAASCGDFGGASRSAGYNRKSSTTDRRRHRLGNSEDDEYGNDDDEYDNDDDGSSFDEARYDRRGSRSRLSTLADETREGAPTAPTADSYATTGSTHQRTLRNHHRNGGEQDFDADPTELFAALHSRNWTGASAALRRDPDQASVWIYRLDDDEAKSAAKDNDNDNNGDNASAVEPQRPIKWRTLPLHAAVLFRAPPKLLRALLEANPLAACHRDDRGMLPLHLAIKTGGNKACVRTLMEAYPQALDERDDQGLLPLDLAKTSTSPYRRAYLNAWAEYYYKLHTECDFDTNPTELYSYLMNREWEQGKKKSGDGKEAKDGAKAEAKEAKGKAKGKGKGKGGRNLTKVLTQADAATWVSRREPRTDEGGSGELRWRMLPLHAAILFQAPDNIVTAILDAHPDAAQGADDSGMLPVHVALAKRCTETVLHALLRAYPQSMTVRDGRGNLPIDVARRSKSVHREAYVEALERNVASYLLEEECDFDANPTSLYLSIEDGNWDVAEHLARNNPEEVRTWVAKREEIKNKKTQQKGGGEGKEGKDDGDGSTSPKDTKVKWRMLPLHAAILFTAPIETIRALIQSYPDGCSCKSSPEKMLPVHIAIKNEMPVDVVELLLMYYPDCLIDADKKGRTVFTLAETSKNPGLRAGYMGALDRGPMYWKRLRGAQEQGGHGSVGDEDHDAGIGGVGPDQTSTALAGHDYAEFGEEDLATPISMKARAQSNVRAARAMDDNGILRNPTLTPARAAATGASAAAALAAANYIHQQQMKGSHVQPQQHPEYYTTSPTQGSHGGDGSDEANFPGKKEQGAISQYLSRTLSTISPSKRRKESKFIGKELVGVPRGSFDVSKVKTRAASPPPQARNGGFSSGGAAKNRSSSAKRLRQKVSKVLRSASRSKSQRSEAERDATIHGASTYSEQRAMAPSNQFVSSVNEYGQNQAPQAGNSMPLMAGAVAAGGGAALMQQNHRNPQFGGAEGGAMAPASAPTQNGVIAPESINVGQPDEIQNVVSDLTDPNKPKTAPESILKPQKRGLGYSPSADANEAAAGWPTEAPVYNGTPATKYRHAVSPGAMLARQEHKEMAEPATHRLVMKSGLKGSKGGMARQRSTTPSRSNGRKDQAAIEREPGQYAVIARNRSAASGTSAGVVLRSGLKDKKKANKKNKSSSPTPRGNGKYSSRMAASNQTSSLKGNLSMVSRDTLQDVQQTMHLLNPNAGRSNGMQTKADLLSRIGLGGYSSADQTGPVRDLSIRAQSMESTGSSITGSTGTAQGGNGLERAVDDAVDAMGEAIFDGKLMSGIVSMLGGGKGKKTDDETITYANSFHLNEIGPQKR